MKLGKIQTAALFLAILVAATDQLSKSAVLAHFPSEGMAPEPVTSFFNLVFVYNHGISFGLFNRAPAEYQPLVFLGIALVISVILLRWLFKTQSRVVSAAIGMILGGAVGNGIDRIMHGAVVDFLDFYAFGHHWPAFNVADSAVVCGVALLFIHSLAFDTNSPQS